jgi:hypothetical protein
MRDCHKFGRAWSSEEHVVCSFKIGYFKLHVLGVIVFVVPKGYWQDDLTNEGGRGSGTTPWKGAVKDRNANLGRPILSKVFKK